MIDAGRQDLADRFSNLWVKMPEYMRAVFLAEMPDIHIMYAEKGKLYSKSRLADIRRTADDNIPAIDELLRDYEVSTQYPENS